MMELYRRHIEIIQSTCNQIKGIQEKIIFLIEEKKSFRLLNKNDDADIVLQWYSDEIDKLKLLLQFENQSTQNREQKENSKVIYNSLGDIRKAINTIRFNYRQSGYKSETFIKYYKQINQPTHVKDIISKKLILLEDYFGAYHDRLNEPYIYWNGFYITPEKVDGLNTLISERRIVFENNFVNDINEIADHIFAYRDGFIEGYNRFDYDEIETPSSIFKSDELSIKKVTGYLYEHDINSIGSFIFQTHPLDRYADTFTDEKYLIPKINKIPISQETCHQNQNARICSERILHNDQIALIEEGYKLCYSCNLFVMPELKKWKIIGFQAGKLYRAWYIALSNYEKFDSHIMVSDLQSKQDENKSSGIEGNDIILSNIEDWLYPFKEESILDESNYEAIVEALKNYFETGTFPGLVKQIRVKKVNKKRFGWALNEIFRANNDKNDNLPVEYLAFAKKNISIFTDVSFDENNYLKSNLYKYFTTKTQ